MNSFETYNDHQKRTLCENCSKLGTGCSISPQCFDGKQEVQVTVVYDEHQYERDTLKLCGSCHKHLQKSCKKHGYVLIDLKKLKVVD